MTSQLNQLIGTLLILASGSVFATNPPGGTCSGGGPCGGSQSGGSTGSSSSPSSQSLEWGVQVGLARYSKPTSLTNFSQAAFEQDGNLPDFKQLFGRYFSGSPLQQMQIRLELSQPQLSSDTFHPSCLFLQSEALFETLKKPAAGGFPEFIHQILTDDAFTLIDILPAPDSGWRLRVWKRNAATLTKIGGFYDTTGFITKTPLNDVVFKRSSGDNTLIYIQKETTGLSGTRTITNEIVQTLDSNGKPSTVTTKLYSGEGTSGPLLSQENLTYSERGTKAWNYTITREILTASVNAAGTIGTLTLTGKTREDYDDFSTTAVGGELGKKRLVSKTEAYNVAGQTPQTTTYTYIESPANSTTHGRLQSSLKPDGSWTYSEYVVSPSSPVSIITEYSGWKDLTMPQRSNARKTVTTVSAQESLVETYVAGQLISKSKTTLGEIGGYPVTTNEKWDGSAWHVTTTAYYPDSATAPATGRIKWIEKNDGTAATFAYAIVSGNLVTTARTGAGSSSGITAGTETKTTYGLGNIPISEVTTDIASNLVTEQWDTDLSYNGGFDQIGRPITRIYNGDVTDYDIARYACCGLEFSRDRMGATTSYFRDGLKRVYKTETKTSDTSPAVSTFTTVNGLTTTETRRVGSSDSLFLGSRTVSIDGLTRTITGPSAKSTNITDRPTTTTVISHSSTGDTETTTRADLSNSITAYYLDGRPKSISGTAIADMTYDYATHNENDGGETSTTSASGVVTTRYTDLQGRVSKVVSGATGTTTYAYYPLSADPGKRTQLHTLTDGDNVIVTYDYNAEGERISTSRLIPLAGSGTATQVTSQDDEVVPDITLHGVSLGVSVRTTQTVSSTGVDPVIVSESFVSRDRLVSGSHNLNGDTLNLVTRPDASGNASRTTINPDGTKSQNTYQHGLLTTVATLRNDNSVIASTSYSYDPFQRRLTSTDARTGATTYDLNSDGLADVTESGLPLAMRSPANQTTYMAYDIMGRQISVTLPDTSVTYTAYDPTGLVKAKWGSQTYPVWHVYDEQGRQTQLHTWKIAPTINPSAVPADPPSGSEVTSWIYSPTSGHLVEKNHPGENDNGSADADYTYTPGGRLHIRTSERGITTTYGYTYGLMTSADYSDSTPDVLFTYEPLGRQETITTSVAKTEFTYDPATLAVDKETVSHDTDANGTFDFPRVLDRHQDALLRDSGWELKDGSTNENAVSYGFDTTGRLRHVDSSYPLPGSPAFSYDYVTNSRSLIDTVSGPAHIVKNNWEADRDVLVDKINHLGNPANPVSKYDYSVTTAAGDGANAIGQRKNLATSGSGFDGSSLSNTAATGPAYAWGYNSRGELEEASDTSSANYDRAYQYDAIGNREKTANGLLGDLPTTANYDANPLNQYTKANGVTLPTPAYDADGNYSNGPLPVATGNATLVWDAENRLVQLTRADSTIIIYGYDHLSRRIYQKVGTAAAERYVYDGWNPIAKYSGTTLVESYTWGIDLSGTLQGAGGVGGLLAVTDEAATGDPVYYPTYDGNGNVSEYLDAGGAIKAHYEYDPFGNTTAATGTKSADFAHRFSTKPLDAATGFYYYLYRYYDPVTGRWPSRDPIWENGGENLYGFVWNRPIAYIDVLGNFGRPGSPGWRPGPPNLGPQDPSDAAVDAGRRHRRKTNKNDLEYCGLVCKHVNNGNIKVTSTSGKVNSCKPYDAPCPNCYVEVRAWHTHPRADAPGGPYDSENFSEADENFSENTGLPLHLNTPGGSDKVINPAGTTGIF
jgi:RHS repeat-associated protein